MRGFGGTQSLYIQSNVVVNVLMSHQRLAQANEIYPPFVGYDPTSLPFAVNRATMYPSTRTCPFSRGLSAQWHMGDKGSAIPCD